MSGPVVALGLDETEQAGALIARAFEADPLAVRLFPDDRDRARLAPVMFTAVVRFDQLFGRVDRLADFGAVAAWQLPGESAETPERLAAAGFDDLPDEVPLGYLDRVFETIGPAIRRAVPEPHWHLRILGVDPDRQGSGLGTALLRHGLDRAEAAGHPVVLETFAERALALYVRNGFEVIVDGVEPTSGLPFWALRR